MKIWKNIKKNYFRFRKFKFFSTILVWLKNIAGPVCPICKHNMCYLSQRSRRPEDGEGLSVTCYECNKDHLIYLYPGPYKGYYEFDGKTFSIEQLKHMCKLKAFW